MAAREVEFRNVSFTASGGHRILREISLRVAPGEIVALLGRSGSGKTTLLRTVNRMVSPVEGSILVGGEDVAHVDPIALRRSIGYVVQEAGLFPHRTVAENVALPLELAGEPRGPARRNPRVREALKRVGLTFDEFAARFPRELSGGQRQRVGVARALVTAPGVLLMDEPFGALDPMTRGEMQSMLRPLLRQAGTTCLVVTHDLDEALFLADRVVLLEGGRVVTEAAAHSVLNTPSAALRSYVDAARHAHDSASPGSAAPAMQPGGAA